MMPSIVTLSDKPVIVIHKLLQLLKIPAARSAVSEALESHPAYPSILSLHDTLSLWGIDTRVIRITNEDLHAYPVPFIADCYTKEGEEYLLVTEVNDNEVHYHFVGKRKFIVTKEQFLQMCSGICLFIDVDKAADRKYTVEGKRSHLLRVLKIPFAITFLFAITLFAILNFSKTGAAGPGLIGYSVWMFLKITGTVITGFLLHYEVYGDNAAFQKVCSAVSGKSSCDAVLQSKHASLFHIVTWSELGFFYFSGGYLALLLAGIFPGQSVPNLFYSLSLLNFISLPYIIFSLYYQWQVIKQWCIFCLSILALLVVECATIIYSGTFHMQRAGVVLNPYFLTPVALMLFITTGWFFIKSCFIKEKEARLLKREFTRLKFNTELFEALLDKQKQITAAPDGLGITIGNLQAANTILKVCNPYCMPCARAHVELNKLLQTKKDLKVQIIFTATTNKDDKRNKPVRHFLAIASLQKEYNTEQALDDWYLQRMKDYEAFAHKYPVNGELVLQDDKIAAMEAWCSEMRITATPTVFVNGRQLPKAYSIADMGYFFS
jgi:uncharacterized membrane protein